MLYRVLLSRRMDKNFLAVPCVELHNASIVSFTCQKKTCLDANLCIVHTYFFDVSK